MKPHSEYSSAPLDLAAIRARLNGAHGQQYWRSLDEVANTPEFEEMLHREFPDHASEWIEGVSRRSFLKLAAASLALAGLTACTKQPIEKILPYVKQPEELVLGEPLFYATAMLLGGFATGVLVKNREGHPIKVDGNPDHPATRGGSSVWMQASILDLYDPDRSQSVTHHGDISTWAAFLNDLNQLLHEHEIDQGAGLRFLTETVTSPTLATQSKQLLEKFPKATWHQFDPVSRDSIREGARLAFGEIVEAQYRFEQADVIVSLEADFLQMHPERLRYTRDFTNGRRVSAGRNRMNRLYVAESTPTISGSMADQRLPLASGKISAIARRLIEALEDEAKLNHSERDAISDWVSAVHRDLVQSRGRSIVIAGESQPPEVHALVHALNEKLGNVGQTVFYTDSAEANPVNQLNSLRELANQMRSGAVKTLFILSGNPVYSAPCDLDFVALLPTLNRSIHLGVERNETAALCTWHIPETHYLESWSDARSFDGTVSLMQPLIAPLYDGKSAHELLGLLLQRSPTRSDYEIVREFWKSQNLWPDFEKGWRRALHDGVIAETALPKKSVSVRATSELVSSAGTAPGDSEIEIVFRPDPSVWDGRFANNGWLQECAKPLTKLTWDNAVLISPALAEREKLSNGDVSELTFGKQTIRGPIWILPGQAENTITLHLGYGRERIGRVGAGVGFNAYVLRTSDSLWVRRGVKIKKTSARHSFATTQTHHNVHSPDRQIVRDGTLEEFLADPQFVKKSSESPPNNQTLYDTKEFPYDGYKWGMSIDLNTCIGCNACLMACNVENNIPVVGKDQVARGREMYWIRIDTYYQGPLHNPQFTHMPVPCMQCEHAPCELVCPVAATVHDHEGLNLQIYNRCVGTRFCSNNCPYKVRRFNFLQYADLKTPSLEPMRNPEVTVRSRGVMEKCTYCVQRIASARIRAEKENRKIREDELQTACQQACPANAIVFGDLNGKDSAVAKLKQHPLDYSMLGELNTRPRTTYLAKLRNVETKASDEPGASA